MKTSNQFQETIKAYLDRYAKQDKAFAAKYQNPKKSIEECCTYILNWVKEQNCNGFADAEIYGQAVHYYDEADIKVGKPVNARVVVNHTVEPEPVAQPKEEPKAAPQAKAEPKAKASSKLGAAIKPKGEPKAQPKEKSAPVKTESKNMSTNLSLWDEL